MYDTQTPLTACYSICVKDNKIALLLRENTTWMNGYWSLPAGKVEKGESFAKGAVRELVEEAGLTANASNMSHAVTIHRYSSDDDTYWVDVFFEALKWQGELVNAEPEKHSEIKWFSLNDLPEKLLHYQRLGIDAWMSGDSYAEHGWENES